MSWPRRLPGIDHWFGLEIDETPLLEIPEPSPIWKVLGWSIPALIIGLFVYGWFFSGVGKSIEMMSWWFFGTGGGAAAGVLLAGGHPLSMVAAFFAAPVAALHPAIATGWFAGLTEAVFRKPKVKDFETIAEDLSSVWGLWKNQVTRILLVTAFANLGCILGALLASVKLVSLLE